LELNASSNCASTSGFDYGDMVGQLKLNFYELQQFFNKSMSGKGTEKRGGGEEGGKERAEREEQRRKGEENER
jgi:hypothetical protein